MLEKIRVCDGVSTFMVTFAELKEKILAFTNTNTSTDAAHFFYYKDFLCKIKYNGNVFCGYVKEFPAELVDLFPEGCIVSDIDNIYEPHGGYTDGTGFDCGHFGDIPYSLSNQCVNDIYRNHTYEQPNSSFKDANFVLLEIQKIVDSILVIAEHRRATNHQSLII